MLTNRLGLPSPIAVACEKADDDYDRGPDTWRTVTELIGPARIAVLMHRHPDKRTVDDVSDSLWRLQGKWLHRLLHEANQDGLAEQRRTMIYRGKVISGQFDHHELRDGTLTDYKSTSVWSLIFKDKLMDWEAQLNLYAWLQECHGVEVTRVQVAAMLDGWSRAESKRRQDYPAAKIVVVPLQRWDTATTLDYLDRRIALHEAAEQELPHCTPSERFQKPSKWALMKPGRKSAISLHDEPPLVIPTGCYIEERPSEPQRCQFYCPMRDFCPTLNDGQFKAGERDVA